MGETTSDAILREIREELGLEERIERVIWTNEKFFTLGGLSHHEIGFYFLMSLPRETHADLSARFYCEQNDG